MIKRLRSPHEQSIRRISQELAQRKARLQAPTTDHGPRTAPQAQKTRRRRKTKDSGKAAQTRHSRKTKDLFEKPKCLHLHLAQK